MPRRRTQSLPASIASLLRRLLRPASRRAQAKPLTVIGQLPHANRLTAANDPEGR